jgi:hypothetical protein
LTFHLANSLGSVGSGLLPLIWPHNSFPITNKQN